MAMKIKRSQLLRSPLFLIVLFVVIVDGASELKTRNCFTEVRQPNRCRVRYQETANQSLHLPVSKHASSFLIPRGGNVDLSLLPSLHIFTVIYLVQGPICMLVPRLNARVYGIQTSQLSPDNDVLVSFLMRGCGTLITGLGVVSWLAEQNSSGNLDVAVAVSNICVVVNLLVSSFSAVPGVPTASLIGGLVIAGLASTLPLLASSSLNGLVPSKLAHRYLQAYMAFGALNGAVGALLPNMLSKPWKLDITEIQATRTLMRTYGTWCVGYCVCCLLLLSQRKTSLAKAVGWGSLPAFVLLLAGNLITKEFDRLGMNKGLMIFWFLFNVLVLTPMLFE